MRKARKALKWSRIPNPPKSRDPEVQRLMQAAIDHGLSFSSIAWAAGVGRYTVQAWKAGRRHPGPENLQALRQVIEEAITA